MEGRPRPDLGIKLPLDGAGRPSVAALVGEHAGQLSPSNSRYEGPDLHSGL